MAEILSPMMPMSATHVSVAVTTVPFRITVSKRICAGLDLSRGFRNGVTVARKDFAAVNFQCFFFIAAHQVDIELRYAGLPQRLEFLAVLLDGTDQAEAVNDFVT